MTAVCPKHPAEMAGAIPPYLSIVIPAFNEARRLPSSLRKIARFCETFPRACEVLIVVEKSQDETLDVASQEIAQQANCRVIDNKVHRGKGFAVRTGMLAAKGEHVFYMDADLSVPVEEISKFLGYFEAHPDAAILVGNRQHPESCVTLPQTVLRRRMGQAFNRILQILSLLRLRDTQCGFKAFRRKAVREIFSRQKLDGFAFDVEVLLLAEALGFRVDDLPVQWINSPESKVRIMRDSFRMLIDAIKVRGVVEGTLREKPFEIPA
jgi:dolichyl-phosphate beta-glucosyltransferase